VERVDDDTRRDAVEELVAVRTSIGEALFYQRHGGALPGSMATHPVDAWCPQSLTLLAKPRTTVEWCVPQRPGADLTHIDEYLNGGLRKLPTDPLARKGAVLDRYLEMIGRKPAIQQRVCSGGEVCGTCGQPLIIKESEALQICTTCGTSETYMDLSTRTLSFGEHVNCTMSTYKRINHFNELLSQLQVCRVWWLCVLWLICSVYADFRL